MGEGMEDRIIELRDGAREVVPGTRRLEETGTGAHIASMAGLERLERTPVREVARLRDPEDLLQGEWIGEIDRRSCVDGAGRRDGIGRLLRLRPGGTRSEERRVGKEWRSRGGQ